MKKFIDCLLHIGCYAIVLILASKLFPNHIILNEELYGVWAILVSMIVFIFNKTIKPILTWLTLPITALTLGLFYPFINVLILKLVSLIFGSYFEVKGIISLALISIFISILNIIMDRMFIKPLLKGDE